MTPERIKLLAEKEFSGFEFHQSALVWGMADIFTPEKRSEVMSKIRGRNTRPELAIRPCFTVEKILQEHAP